MIKITLLIGLFFYLNSCSSQNKENSEYVKVGGPCEGCEAIYEYGNKELLSIDTLPLFDDNEPKTKITGLVFKDDAKTPAKGVIIYIYHTNRKGYYQTEGTEEGWTRRHGVLRGWVKTNDKGEYTFYSFRPAAYPDRQEPEHIHVVIKEPNRNEYYIDDFMFTDDPLLTQKQRERLNKRGGSGIVLPKFNRQIYIVRRDIILGRNIPNYN